MRRAAMYSGTAVSLLGLVVVVGWLTGADRLTMLVSGTVNVKLNTALGLLGVGVAATLVARGVDRGGLPRRSAQAVTVVSAVVATLMMLTLMEYVLGVNLGIDDPLDLDRRRIGTPYPGRVPVAGALSLTCVALALIAVRHERVRGAQRLAIVALLGGAAGLVADVFDVRALHDPVYGNTVALPAAAGVTLAACAVLWLRPDEHYVSLLAGNTAGGVLTRRLLPWALLTPVVAGAVASWLVTEKQVQPNNAFAALVTGLAVAGACLVWFQGSRLRFVDLRRSGAEDALEAARQALEARDEMAARLVSQDRYLRRIMATSVDGYIAVDASGRVTAWNEAATDIFGWSSSLAVGARLEDLIIPEDRVDEHKAALRRYAETGEGRILGRVVELEARHRDGHVFPVELSVWAVTDEMTPSIEGTGEQLGFHAFVRDVTSRKSTEAQLQAANEDLEIFATIAAHDLRSPLAVMRTSAELLLPEIMGEPTPELAVDSARRIVTAADRGIALIEDLLTYARSGSQQGDFERVDLDELCRSVAVEQMSFYRHPGAVEVGSLPSVVGDEDLLRQLMGNLVGNALKYAAPGRPIRVRVTGRVEEAPDGMEVDHVVIEVTDEGDPIPAADRERIFKAFERGSRSDGQRGSGIGLAICTRVAELHGGSIALRTRPDGNTFEVRLPKGTAPQAPGRSG